MKSEDVHPLSPEVKSPEITIEFSNWLDRLIYSNQEEYSDTLSDLNKRIEIIKTLCDTQRRIGFDRMIIKKFESLLELKFGKDWKVKLSARSAPLRILDLGTGLGGLLESLARWAKNQNLPLELEGLELENEYVEHFNKQQRDQTGNIKLFQGDVANLEHIPSDSYDFVFCIQMIHHLRDPKIIANLFSEVFRISSLGWFILDVRRCLRGIPYMLSSLLLGCPYYLAIDGVRSIRRAYRPAEIEKFISFKDSSLKDKMPVKAFKVLPYWKVTGLKRTD